MKTHINHDSVAHFSNPRASRGVPIGDRQRAVLNLDAMHKARDEIRTWPGYAPTPLVSLKGLAKEAKVASITYKDEAHRFSLNSFKALGAPTQSCNCSSPTCLRRCPPRT